MFQNKKTLLFAGLAAYAWYKYSQMSTEEKSKLVSNIKDKAKSLFDKYLPEQAKNLFTDPGTADTANRYS